MTFSSLVGVTNLKKQISELKERRKTYGVSQNKLATSVGISRQYLSESVPL